MADRGKESKDYRRSKEAFLLSGILALLIPQLSSYILVSEYPSHTYSGKFMAALTTALSMTLFAYLLIATEIPLAESTTLTIVNNCKESIWPGILPNNNSVSNANFSGGGFTLKPGQSDVFSTPPGWNGRIWGRTGCNFDKDGSGQCETGDCGSTIKCNGPGKPPASIAEFAFGNLDYYDVSLVDGFNLPIVVKPISGKGTCKTAGCESDLRPNCSSELVVNSNGKSIACNSACNVFNTDEYCCRGEFSTPMTCRPSNYSRTFKAACPAAFSYAYDDASSIITCSAADYVITFCSSRNQQCTYHDKKLSCNGSKGLITLSPIWQIMVLVLPAVINLQAMF